MAGNKFKLLDAYAFNPARREQGEKKLRIGLDGGKVIGDFCGFRDRLEREASALLRDRVRLQGAEHEMVQAKMHKEHLARIDEIFAATSSAPDSLTRRQRAKEKFMQGAKASEIRSILREGKRPIESIQLAVRKLKAQRRKLKHHMAEERRELEHRKREVMR